MKPPIEYRPAAPKKAATAVPGLSEADAKALSALKRQGGELSRALDAFDALAARPEPKGPNGRWVWVTNDQMITTRSKTKSRAYQREYMRAYRKKRQRPIEKEESTKAGKGDNPR